MVNEYAQFSDQTSPDFEITPMSHPRDAESSIAQSSCAHHDSLMFECFKWPHARVADANPCCKQRGPSLRLTQKTNPQGSGGAV